MVLSANRHAIYDGGDINLLLKRVILSKSNKWLFDVGAYFFKFKTMIIEDYMI